MSVSALGVILAAVVTYVAPDGLFLDEGADDGVRVGDVVQVGKQRLTIASVAPGRARTSPPTDVFAVKVGAQARIQRTGEPAISTPVEPRKASAPQIEDEAAVTWWPGAGDGWVEPRPLPTLDGRPARASALGLGGLGLGGLRIDGVLGLDGRLVELDDRRWRAGAYSRLAVDGERWWYRHDVRLDVDNHSGRWPEPPVDLRRLEAGWRGDGFGLRAGRMVLADPLAAASLDGAALGTGDDAGRLQLFAGLAPEAIERTPDQRSPQVGLSGEARFELDAAGDYTGRAAATALISGFEGGLDRLALAPEVSVRGGPIRVMVRGEFDAYAGQSDSRSGVEATRLYGSIALELADWVDVQVRYDRYQTPDLPSLRGAGPLLATTRQTAYGDIRFDLGAIGVTRASAALMDSPDGLLLVPGLDHWVALADWVDLSLAAFYRESTYDRLTHGRARLSFRWDAPWPTHLDLGARVNDAVFLDHDELSGTELTAEVGVWTATPAGFDLRLVAERTTGATPDAPSVPMTLVFGDLRWRF